MMSHVLRCAAGCACAAWLACFQLAAQESKTQKGGDVLVLDTVVVSGKKAPEQGGAEPIPGETLRTHKVVDLAEILADEMVEATMIRKAGYGNEVSLRGFGKSNLRISLDGSMVEGACGGRKDPSLSHLNLLEIERIEVREGPFDVTQAGALGGGVEVESKEPEPGFHGELMTKVGSFGYLNTGGYVTGGNEWIQALIGYGYAESDQYEDGDGNQLSTFTNNPYLSEYEDMKSFRKQDAWGKLRLTPSLHDTFLFAYSHGEATDILYPRGPFDIPSERTRLARASYTRTDLSAWSEELSLSLYRNTVEHDPSQEYRGNAPAPEAISRITGGQLQNIQTTEFATFTYGMDAHERRWHAEVFHAFNGNLLNPRLIPDVRTWNLGAYAQMDKELGDLSLQAGGRLDWQRSKATRQLAWGPEAGEKPVREETAPSGFLSATYRLGERVEVFGGVGRSTRMPNGVERYLQGGAGQYGNPDLAPTRNSEIDFGAGYTDGLFQIRAKVFYSDLRDYIYQEVDTAGAATWANIDARLYGGDVTTKIGLGHGWSAQAAVALQRGRKRVQPNSNDDGDLAEIPPWKSKLGVAYETKRATAELEWVHSGRASHVDLDAGETVLASWDVLNLRLGYQISDSITLNAGINNILDEDYAVANSYEWDVIAGAAAAPAIVDEPGRFFYASLSYSF